MTTTSTASRYFVDPRGQFVGDVGEPHNEELLVRDLDLDLIQEVRQTWQFFRDRRPDPYADLVRPDRLDPLCLIAASANAAPLPSPRLCQRLASAVAAPLPTPRLCQRLASANASPLPTPRLCQRLASANASPRSRHPRCPAAQISSHLNGRRRPGAVAVPGARPQPQDFKSFAESAACGGPGGPSGRKSADSGAITAR